MRKFLACDVLGVGVSEAFLFDDQLSVTELLCLAPFFSDPLPHCAPHDFLNLLVPSSCSPVATVDLEAVVASVDSKDHTNNKRSGRSSYLSYEAFMATCGGEFHFGSRRWSTIAASIASSFRAHFQRCLGYMVQGG